MSIFGGGSSFGNTSVFGAGGSTNHNPMKDIEVTSPPDDSVSAIAFSPGVLPSTFLVAGSWDNNVCTLVILAVNQRKLLVVTDFWCCYQ